MKIIVSDKQDKFEQRLRNYINALVNPMFLDITLDGESRQVLTLSEGGHYTLSYSRPLFINIFKPPLAEYEFVFLVEKNSSMETTTIVGNIKLKKYIIGAISFVVLILLYKIYNIVYDSAPLDWIFLIVMPLILCLCLIIEWFFFRRKVINFITRLSD